MNFGRLDPDVSISKVKINPFSRNAFTVIQTTLYLGGGDRLSVMLLDVKFLVWEQE